MSSKPLYFITSAKSKYEEAKAILPELLHLSVDLPEIQEIDAKAIIQAKLKEAFKLQQGEFIVEDTSLYFDALNGLPGPLIKWFQLKMGNDGLAKITALFKNPSALAVTCIGYAKTPNDIHFFEGELKGCITDPKGNNGFGWDPIFIPQGHKETLAEMNFNTKNSLSMRRMAFERLKNFLSTQ